MADLTPRLPIERALDLGTGCGLQALLAAGHADCVIATDLNPRAVIAAGLNARRNGINNIEVRQGDLFAPVAGERFDLIVANPPYVVSPDARFLYRDGGWRAGGICARIVRALPPHLLPGGFAVVQAQWPLRRDESWWYAPQRWTEAAGLDLWLVGHGWAEPEAYAAAWLQDGSGAAAPARAEVQRWQRWYQSEEIAAIMTGVLILRQTSGPGWRRAVQAARKPEGSCSRQIVRIFEAQDWLRSATSVHDLLHSSLQLAEGSRLEGLQDGRGALIRSRPDIGWSGVVNAESRPLVMGLDGRRTLLEIAASHGAGRAQRLSAGTLANIRQLFGAGFLEAG